MGLFRRRAQQPIWPPPGTRLGINEGPPVAWTADAQRPDPIVYWLDLDIGEVADGHHLIASSISLMDEALLKTGEARVEK
jgi:hypothetical protein